MVLDGKWVVVVEIWDFKLVGRCCGEFVVVFGFGLFDWVFIYDFEVGCGCLCIFIVKGNIGFGWRVVCWILVYWFFCLKEGQIGWYVGWFV